MRRTGYIVLLIVLTMLTASCQTVRHASPKGDVTTASASTTSSAYSPQFLYSFYAAHNALSLGEYDKGMALLLFCKTIEPTDAATLQSLGYMWQALQVPQEAEDYYRRAFERDSKSYWANYSALLYGKKDYAATAEVLKKAANLNPQDTSPLEALLEVYKATDDSKKALQVLDKIESVDGINRYTTAERYRLYLTMGQVNKAIQSIDRYLQDNPDDMQFRALKADIYMRSGKEKEALTQYFQCLADNPENPYALVSLAGYCIKNNDPQRAAEYMKRAVLSDELSLDEKIRYYNFYAETFRKTGVEEQVLRILAEEFPLETEACQPLLNYYLRNTDYTAAKEVMRSMLDIHPDDGALWKQAIQILSLDTASSNEEFMHVIEGGYALAPDDMEWRYWQCRLLMVENRLDSMVVLAEQTLLQEGDARYRLPLCIMLGDVYMLWEKTDDLYRVYDRALQIDPQNAYVLNNYAYTLATHGGDLRKAERMSQKTIEQEPDNATYLDTYAWILYLQGQNMLAKFYIQKAKDNMNPLESEEIEEHYKIINN